MYFYICEQSENVRALILAILPVPLYNFILMIAGSIDGCSETAFEFYAVVLWQLSETVSSR